MHLATKRSYSVHVELCDVRNLQYQLYNLTNCSLLVRVHVTSMYVFKATLYLWVCLFSVVQDVTAPLSCVCLVWCKT